LRNGEPDARRVEDAVEKEVFDVRSSHIGKFLNENDNLSQADVQVLKLADEENAVAIMDETYGRKVAEVENIETKGTAFIVLKLLKKGYISEQRAEEIIDDMVEAGWYCSTDLYKEIMKKIEEVS
jgi:predicted nucleic acid-binding protein